MNLPNCLNGRIWNKIHREEICQENHQTVHNYTTNHSTYFPIQIVYVWALVFLGMVIYVFVWFTMGMVVMSFIDAIVASANFAAPWDTVVQFCRNCFLMHPIISLIGWFLYGIINSMRRDVETWRQ